MGIVSEVVRRALAQKEQEGSMKNGGKVNATKKKDSGMKESKEMMKKEVAFMKKKGAPKSMVKHEMKEAGMKNGGMAKLTKAEKPSKMSAVKTAKPKMGSASSRADGVATKGKTKGVMMRKGGMCK